jgi:hypothetical protein
MVANQRDGKDQPEVKDPVMKFRDRAGVDRGIQWALREVRIKHKKMGVPLVGWKDGKIVSIPPEEIQIDEPARNDQA